MAGDEGLLDQSEIEALFGSVKEPKAADAPAGPASAPPAAKDQIPPVQLSPYSLSEIAGAEADPHGNSDISLILDVDLNVRVELGRTKMYIEDVLRLGEGSVIPLEKLAGDPVDIFVNGRLMARGEVLVLNDNFCVRLSEIIGDEKETESTGRD